jgi:hypothetical protein
LYLDKPLKAHTSPKPSPRQPRQRGQNNVIVDYCGILKTCERSPLASKPMKARRR